MTDRPRPQGAYSQKQNADTHSRRRDRRVIPPTIQSCTQHILRGTQPTGARVDQTQAGTLDITCQLGGVFIVLKDKEAALSALELAYQQIQVIERYYPNLDALLERQRLERAESLRIENRGDVSVLNGGEPLSTRMAREQASSLTIGLEGP